MLSLDVVNVFRHSSDRILRFCQTHKTLRVSDEGTRVVHTKRLDPIILYKYILCTIRPAFKVWNVVN